MKNPDPLDTLACISKNNLGGGLFHFFKSSLQLAKEKKKQIQITYLVVLPKSFHWNVPEEKEKYFLIIFLKAKFDLDFHPTHGVSFALRCFQRAKSCVSSSST